MFTRGKRTKTARTGHIKKQGRSKSSDRSGEGKNRSRGGSFLDSLFEKSRNRRKVPKNKDEFNISLSHIEEVAANKTSDADYLINQDLEQDDYRGSFMACLRGTEIVAPPSLENRGDRFASGLSEDSLGMVLNSEKKPVKFSKNPKLKESASDLDKLELQPPLKSLKSSNNVATASLTEIEEPIKQSKSSTSVKDKKAPMLEGSQDLSASHHSGQLGSASVLKSV